MHDDSVLVAIEAALAHPAFCGCGDNLTVRVHDGGAWLECASLARPSRLPAPIARVAALAARSPLRDRAAARGARAGLSRAAGS